MEQPKKMMLSKAVPDGLKPQECKRGNRCNYPPIPYVHEKDVLQEAMDATANTKKLALLDEVEL